MFESTPPCGERLSTSCDPELFLEFQSTLPVWGATHPKLATANSPTGFNPRSLRESDPTDFRAGHELEVVSIHAPRLGSDLASR
jgi:hypothetical protein